MRGAAILIAAVTMLLCPPACAASLPPASVVVAFDARAIRPLLAEGLADRATARAVTADDPVRVASISKLVTSLGVLRMVDRGSLDLDRDVSDYLGWHLRNPAFPDAPITLRMLLSHQSSLTDGADYIIPLGETMRARLADPRAWDSQHAPGSGWFAYTNLNFPVVASVMEAASGERFDRLMQRLVLKPLKLDACYNWSGCSPAAIARAVVLMRANGDVAKDDLAAKPPPCPVVTAQGGPCDLTSYTPGWNGALFSPQGGLRISMRDLARIGQMLARGARGFLSAKSHAALTAAAWAYDGRDGGLGEGGTRDGFFCQYGLGLHRIASAGGPDCRDDPFGDGTLRLGHSGSAYGLRSGLWFDPASGRGLVFFTSAVADDEPQGRSAFTLREEALIRRAIAVR